MGALVTAAFAMPNFFTSDAQAAKPCSARTRYGVYNGFVDKRGVRTWLGVPYAQPPVGKLRWHAPEPLQPTDKTFNAKKFGFSPNSDKNKRDNLHFFKPHGAIVYDDRILTIKSIDTVSILTLDGRIFVPMSICQYLRV